MTNSKLQDQSNYVVAFLAVAVGLLIVVVLLSWVIHLIDWSGIVNPTVSSILAALAGLVTGAVAGYTTNRRDKIKLESLFYKEEQEAIQAQYRMKTDGNEYAFLEHYEFVTGYAREYIR